MTLNHVAQAILNSPVILKAMASHFGVSQQYLIDGFSQSIQEPTHNSEPVVNSFYGSPNPEPIREVLNPDGAWNDYIGAARVDHIAKMKEVDLPRVGLTANATEQDKLEVGEIPWDVWSKMSR